MTKSINVEPGTVWLNQWQQVKVKITSIEKGVVTAIDLADQSTKHYPSIRAFLDIYVSAD
ncbi:MAG: hypothetical protein AAF555_07190 [Verrucomicrobiota bacterium]